MEDLKKLIGDELFTQLAAKLGEKQLFMHDKGQTVAVVSTGQWFPKDKWDQVNAEKKALEGQISDRDNQLTLLKKDATGNKDLQDQIKVMQDQNKDAKAKMDADMDVVRRTFALKEHLMNAGVADADARDLLALKFDPSKLEVGTDGKIKGFDELLKPIKENKTLAAMFGKEVVAGRTPAEGGSTGEFYTRDEVQAMTQEQVSSNLDKVNKSVASWK